MLFTSCSENKIAINNHEPEIKSHKTSTTQINKNNEIINFNLSNNEIENNELQILTKSFN